LTAIPTAVPGEGSMLRSGSSITLTEATSGSIIYYTLDGSTPTTGSPSGSGSGTQVFISGSPGDRVTVKTLVTAPGFFDRTAEFGYTITGNVLTVNDFTDGPGSSSDITLRYALQQSQINNGLTIKFGASGAITLTSPLPQIGWDVAIDGTGQSVSISGNDQIRVFTVDSGNVAIKNLTIEHGLALGGNGTGGSGGGDGTGGGLLITGGSVAIDHTDFSNNKAQGGGGDTGGAGGNGLGGAIYVDAGSLTIQNSLFENNTATGGTGGGSGGSNGNGIGAAIYNRNGTVTVPDNSNTFGTGSSVYNVALPAYELVWQTQPGDGVKDGALDTVPALALKDACGNIVTGDNTSSVTISLTTPNGANLSGAAVTVAGGIATFSALSVDKTGAYTLTASCGSIASTSSDPFTVYKNLVSVEAVAAITQVPNGTEKTAEKLGLPSLVVLVTNEGNVQADVAWDVASCSYDPDNISQQTFAVNGTVTLPDEVKNTNSVSLQTSISVAVNAAETTDKTLASINSPANITGLAHCADKTASAFGLPGGVTMATNYGNVQANVAWDTASCSYDPANTAEQTFTVSGTAALPDGVINPDGVSLAVSASVTVKAGQLPMYKTLVSVSAPAAVTGVPNGSPKTAAGLGLPSKVTLVTDAGDVLGDVSWDVETCPYDPASGSPQSFTVGGTAALPQGLANTNNVSLSVTITVNTIAGIYDYFYGVIPPSDISGLPNGTQKTSAALGLPSKVVAEGGIMVDASWDVDSCAYDSSVTSAQTFTVNGTITLPAWLEDVFSIGNSISINVTVNAADAGSRTLQSVLAPPAVTGLTNGTAKTDSALGLPQTVPLQTDAGVVNAGVAWDVASSAYHPSTKTVQAFTVNGTISMPYGVVNPGKVDLHTTVNVTVDAAKYVLTILAGDGGTITQGSDGLYAVGTQIPIIAAPDTNYGFGGWNSSGGGTFADANNLSTTFTMPAAAATVRANFTPPRTVTDSPTGISIGGGINETAQLTVTPLAKDSTEYRALVAAMDNGGQGKALIFAFDISLEPGGPGQTYLGELTLALPVGAGYNGQTLMLLHYVNGTVEKYPGVAANGLLNVTVTHLSPFAVEVNEPESGPTPSISPTASPTSAPSTAPAASPTQAPSTAPAASPAPGNANSSPAITVSGMPDGGRLYVGGRARLVPSISGGTWIYNHSLLSLTKNSDGSVTIMGLKEGTTTMEYTIGYASVQIPVTILARGLPQTGQDFTPVFMLLILAGCVFTAAIGVSVKIKR
jgi:hypothetical protein